MQTHFLVRPGHPRLRYALTLPRGIPRAAVLLTPGYMEHIGRYEHVAEVWNAAGFAVAIHDPRGQGESGGRRGHILHFSEFVEDVQAVLRTLHERDDWQGLGPPILAGHSMGGLISTEVALATPGAFRGLALMSPFFGIAHQAPAWKIWVGRSVSRFWPTFTEQAGLSSHLLTHDPARAASMDADPLTQDHPITARWFTEMEAAHRDVKRRFLELNLPIFCLAAGDDRVADVNETRALFKAAASAGKPAELKVLADQYHELHQEVLWRDYMLEFAAKFETWSANSPR